MAFPRFSIFRLKRPSLARGVLLAMGAMGASLRLAGFPDEAALHASPWQALLVPAVLWSLVETWRAMGSKLNFYFAGVLLLLYTELMVLALVLFLWLYL